jgi:Sulfotransferase family
MSTFMNRAGLGLARVKKALVYRLGSPELGRANRKLARQEQELAALRAMLAKRDAGGQVEGIRPENVIWVLGSGRTGSSWLTFMMGSLPGHTRWNEPRIGTMFGQLYYEVAWTRQATKHFILANDYEETWLSSLRSLVLSGALTRFPERAEGGYVVIKEPHGSLGAPLLMKALPESRMIFLVRDPRDVVASTLAVTLVPKGGRDRASRVKKVETQAEKFVKQRAKTYLRDIKNTEQAYEAHEGRKVLVRYEDLRADTLETMKRIYSTLEIPVDEGDLARAVEKRAFENIPEEEKGEGTIRRKATPGGWREDLTPEQAKIVEKEAAQIIDQYYAGG